MIRFSSIQQYFLIFSTLMLSWGVSNHGYAQAFKVSKTCLSECTDSTAATIFKDTITTSKATAWTWDFGDIGSGAKNTSQLKTAAHLYSTAGVKTVTIEIEGELKQAEIYSLQGQKVMQSNSKNVNISNLSKGMYMVRIEDVDNAVATKKLVIE